MSGFGKGARHTEETKAKMRAAVRKLHRDPQERFWEKIDKTPGQGPWGDCWTCRKVNKQTGYGHFYFQSKERTAHVVSFYFKHGRFPVKPLEIDHRCRVRACVNPDHLEEVTRRVNAARGDCGWVTGAKMKARTHCKNGHEFTSENTFLEQKGRSIKRRCRACGRAVQARLVARKKAQYNETGKEQDGGRYSDSDSRAGNNACAA